MDNKLNKVLSESFKKIFDGVTQEATQKVVDMGYDPASVEGKTMIFSMRKKVLSNLGIDLGQYTSDEFLSFWEDNKEMIMKDIEAKIESNKDFLKSFGDLFSKELSALKDKKINWSEIVGAPKSVADLGHTDNGHPNILSSIQTLFKNIVSIRETLMANIEEKVKNIKFWHKDLKGIGPDDHHPEKHTLESHIESPLMLQLLAFIKNPTGMKMRGGGATAFNQLVDVPLSYAGQAGKGLRVKAGADGLEFYTLIGDTDEKAKVSANDTTAGYLNSKISVSGGLTKSITSPAGNEVLNIAGPDLTSYETLKKVVADKSSAYPIVVGDTGKVLVDTNGITFTLPVIAAGNIGTKITIVKNNAGTTTIQANTGQFIADSTSAGQLYNDVAAETWATITLVAISTTQWVILGQDGTWTAI